MSSPSAPVSTLTVSNRGCMTPEVRFKNQAKDFWANVRLLSQQLGYTVRGKGIIKVPTINAIA